MTALIDSVVIDYTNHRGERGIRTIVPQYILFGLSEWHPEKQWLLMAFDFNKGENREFSMKDIHSWAAVT